MLHVYFQTSSITNLLNLHTFMWNISLKVKYPILINVRYFLKKISSWMLHYLLKSKTEKHWQIFASNIWSDCHVITCLLLISNNICSMKISAPHVMCELGMKYIHYLTFSDVLFFALTNSSRLAWLFIFEGFCFKVT